MKENQRVSGKLRIGIVNYGMGNIGSVAGALKALGVDPIISSSGRTLERVDAIILPGVGAFAPAMDNLRSLGLDEILNREVCEKRKPFLGICLGMQLLAQCSFEGGFTEGLGFLAGSVHFMKKSNGLPIPHVGWNNVLSCRSSMFMGIDQEAHFYFDHGYILRDNDSIISSWADYGELFAASVVSDNIWATQFHPEKSQRNGLKMLRNFTNFALKSL